MKTPLQRIRFGAIVLTVIVVGSVIGYRALGYGWLESVWMVVITIASVGFGERSQASPGVQVLTIGLILFGMSAAAYTLGGFLQMITEGEVDRVLSHHRVSRGIESLREHTIVCGFGRTGQILASELAEQKRPFVIIDSDPALVEEAKSRDYLSMAGDATEDEVLLQAGIQRATSIVTVLPNDAANVFITLTARNLNPKIQIIARAEVESTEKKLRQAGADRVVMPAIIGAHRMVRMITRPTTADLMELVSESNYLEMELDEIQVAPASQLVGVTVRQTEAHRRHRLLVVAVKQAEGNMVFNPDADYTFRAGDVVIVMGRREDIQRFCQEFGM